MADVEQPEGEPQGRIVKYCGGMFFYNDFWLIMMQSKNRWLTQHCSQFALYPPR